MIKPNNIHFDYRCSTRNYKILVSLAEKEISLKNLSQLYLSMDDSFIYRLFKQKIKIFSLPLSLYIQFSKLYRRLC